MKEKCKKNKQANKQTAKKIQAKAESSIRKRSYNERVRAK